MIIPYFISECKKIHFFEVYYTHSMIGLLIGANLLQVGIYILRMHSIPPQIPLLYSLPVGEDQLVEWWMIFLIPAIMNVLCFLNILVYRKYFHKEAFERSLLKYHNVTVIGVCTYIFIRIIFLVS